MNFFILSLLKFKFKFWPYVPYLPSFLYAFFKRINFLNCGGEKTFEKKLQPRTIQILFP